MWFSDDDASENRVLVIKKSMSIYSTLPMLSLINRSLLQDVLCCINLVSLNMTPQQKKRHLYTIKHAMTFKYNIPHNAICHETPAPNLALPFLYTRPTLSPTNPMDQETANALFEQGACLLFLEAPPNLEFGIDYNAWTIGPLFKGVKMIPPGLHFVYFS